jgi:adenine C2-methylase RlmN of 23S rRNA A2503 and tRNA A37
MKSSILNANAVEIFAKEHKLPAFKLKQIFHEIFKNQTTDIDEMTTLSKDLREQIKEQFEVIPFTPEETIESKDNIKI